MIEQIIGIIVGFITFFAFPIVEFLIKRKFSGNIGNPELWYLPSFGFRLVIRNIPNNTNLFDIKYKTILRGIIPSNQGSSVSTLHDEVLVNSEDMFLISGYDQIIIAFQLKKINGKRYFVHTDKLGTEKNRYELDTFNLLISDYKGTIDNKYHFDVPVGRRVEINRETLNKIFDTIQSKNMEQRFEVDRIIKIG